MATQMLWIVFVVFVLGLFIGSNLGVMMMCLLYVAGQKRTQGAELASVSVPMKS